MTWRHLSWHPSKNFHAAPTGVRLATMYNLACSCLHARQIFNEIGSRNWNSSAPKLRPSSRLNKPRVTSDEGNQLKSLQLRSGKTAVISTTTEACTSPMRGGFTLLAFPLSVWVLVGSDRNEEGTPIYIWMNSARAELHLFSILHVRIKIPPAAS
ncbi:hypothetical protein AVEN_136505-1 [Araneus ventricosus]|uniref:Uncharacterized protein n=1 Tax=Araneus ventricosus TaxID=182803 RepID=A0A4Y2IRJ8_ARAVE|nr:hypothetical protein AVEN_136505-1 [Araneus ventricosus]